MELSGIELSGIELRGDEARGDRAERGGGGVAGAARGRTAGSRDREAGGGHAFDPGHGRGSGRETRGGDAGSQAGGRPRGVVCRGRLRVATEVPLAEEHVIGASPDICVSRARDAVHFYAGVSGRVDRNGDVIGRALARRGDEVFAAGEAVPGRDALLVVPYPVVSSVSRVEVPFYTHRTSVAAINTTHQVDGKCAVGRGRTGDRRLEIERCHIGIGGLQA